MISVIKEKDMISVDEAFDKIRKALRSVERTAKKEGMAVVYIDMDNIRLCEKPFPLTEGNIALDEIEMFKVAQEINSRKCAIFENLMYDRLEIAIKV